MSLKISSMPAPCGCTDAMRRVPQRRLVVHDVVAHAAAGCAAVLCVSSCTKPFWKLASAGSAQSLGSLLVMLLPPALTPLPASGIHCASLPLCAPYLAIEKHAVLARAGRAWQPSPSCRS